MIKTNIFGSVLLGASALALSACGGGDSGGGSGETTANTTTTTTTTAEPVAEVDYASLTGDAANGEQVFAQCMVCHVTEAGVNRVGPSLHAIIGRESGTIEGFNYSEANRNSNITWTEEELFDYLRDPQAKIPGTIMAFAGLPEAQDRADVIAYLKTQG